MKNFNYTRPWMYPKQSQAFFCDERYAITEASTKAGKTVGCIAWLFEQAYKGKKGRNYWWVAPIYGQAKIAFRRMLNGLPPEVIEVNRSELTITLPNGAVMWFKGADNSDSLFGEDVYALVVDEASRCSDEAWYACRSVITATKGPVRVIGNVKGRKNWAYELARRAEQGAPGMRYTMITAYDAVEAGVLDMDEVEDAKSQLPEHVFKELYLCQPADDGGNPFGIDAIRACIGPLSDADPICWGWDLAMAVDYTVGIALDAAGRVCRFQRWHKDDWKDTKDRIVAYTGTTPALVDASGLGSPVLEDLQDRSPGVFEGFQFTHQSKQDLMLGLSVAIQEKAITFPNGEIVKELEIFEYVRNEHSGKVHYSAPGSMHDDCVISLGLAVRHFGTHKRDFLPYGWLRRDAAFRESVFAAA